MAETDEIKNDTITEPAVTEITEVKPEPKESIIARIGEKIKNFVSTKEVEPIVEGDEIPDEFTNIALKEGWTEEDIKEFTANYTDEELVEMLPYLQTDVQAEPEVVPLKTNVVTPTPVKPNENIVENDAIKALRKEIDDLKKGLGAVNEDKELRSQTVLMETVNKAFDEVGKEFEVFGKTEELSRFPAGPKKGQIVPTSPAMKARSEVWDKAQAFMAVGESAGDAIQDALIWYKGKYLVKDVERKVIKDLKSRETKLSGKRTSHETATLPKYGPDVVREVARKAGREII